MAFPNLDGRPVEYRNIKNLKPWDKNPRGIKSEDFKRLKTSIQKRGQFKPLIITKDGAVLGGNMRLKAYQELGINEVWVSVVDASDDKNKLEYALADNDRAGYYEEDKLAELIMSVPDLDLKEFKVDLGQLTDLQVVLDKFGPADVVEDEAPEVSQEEPISKLGEVYQLGRHRLMCGDSTKIEDVEKLMDGQKADMVLTDPPYGIDVVQNNAVGGGKLAPVNNYSPIIGDDTIQTATDAYNLCVALGIEKLIFWGGNYYANVLPNARCWIVWNKKNTGNFADAELAWTNLKGGVRLYEITWNGMIREGESGSRVHPTQKPIKLMANIITEYEGNKVLDLFGGSGSTLIACEQTERTCYMMELDPRYCDVIRKRYAKFIDNEEEWQEATPTI